MTATQCSATASELQGPGKRKRRSLWAEFPTWLKAQAGLSPSHSGAAGPLLSNSLSFADAKENFSFLLPLGPEMSQIKEASLSKMFPVPLCLRAQPIQGSP